MNATRSPGSTFAIARKIASAGDSVMAVDRRGIADRAEHAVQPGASEGPFVLHGGRRQVERAGGLLDAQAGEIPQRHDLRLARIGLLEARQGFVDGDEIDERRIDAHDRAVELDALRGAPMPDALVVPRALDQDAAHRERGGGEEVPPPVPVPVLAITGDAKVRLVDERRRLQRLVLLALACEAGPRELTQFVIHFGQLVVRCARAAVVCNVA